MAVGLGESSQQQKLFYKASELSHDSDAEAGVSFYKETNGTDTNVDRGDKVK